MTQTNGNGNENGHADGEKSQFAPFVSEGVKGYHEFVPLQPQAVGSLLPAERFPQNANPPKLFDPIEIRGVVFPNRLSVSPMCMYSSDNGKPTDFHFVHYGSMATRGWGSIMVEASGIVPEGRITPEDSGLWSDEQIPGFKRIVDFVHAHKGVIGIQLAHAGRKASTMSPFVEKAAREGGWKGGSVVPEKNGGWETVAPSEISFKPGSYPDPIAASADYLVSLKQAYLDAVERCKAVGFDFIEIHGAHGYFMHEFCSPISNKRTDRYGGNFENRVRLSLEIAEAVRAKWDKPLFYRVSASDWLEDTLGPEKLDKATETGEEWAWWGLEQTTILARRLSELGIDLLDVSSGGNDLRANIAVGWSYQLPFAKHIKHNVPNLLVGAVGMITEPKQANDIVERGDADIVFMAREVLRDIDFPLRAALELGPAVQPMQQYAMAWSRMVVKRDAADKPAKTKGDDEVEGEEGKKKSDARL